MSYLTEKFSSFEKYGNVSLRHRHQRQSDHSLTATSDISYGLDKKSWIKKREINSFACPFHNHMHLLSKIILPALVALYFNHHSPLPLIVTIYSSLVVYALDLFCSGEILLIGIWISFWAITMSLFHEFYRWGGDNNWGFLSCIFDVSLIGCMGFMATLMHPWVAKNILDYAVQIEKILHSFLPISSAGVVTHTLSSTFNLEETSVYLYLVLLHYNLGLIQKKTAVFDDLSTSKEKSICKAVFLLSPTLIRFWYSFSWDISTLSDFLLISILSFMLQPKYREYLWKSSNSITVSDKEKLFLWVGLFVVTLAFDFKYLLPLSHFFSRSLGEVPEQPAFIVCSFFSIGSSMLLLSIHLINKRNDDGQLVLGKIHDDVILIMALFSIILMGSVFPLPLDMLFLIATSVILLGLFTVTKMVRFLLVALFLHGSGLTLFGLYRFRFEKQYIWIIPGYIQSDLFWLYLMELCLDCMVMLAYGFAASLSRRSKSFFQLNLTGVLLLFYSVMIPFVEAALHFAYVQHIDDFSGSLIQHPSTFQLMAMTSAATICISLFLRQLSIISDVSSSITIAVSLAKALSLFIEPSSVVNNSERHSLYLFVFSISSCFMTTHLLVLHAAKSNSEAMVKDSTCDLKRYGRFSNPSAYSVRHMRYILVFYMVFVIPVTLLFVIQWIWNPLLALKSFHDFYSYESSAFEIFAETITLWGVLVFSVLSSLFPNRKVVQFKRVSFMAFVFGLILCFLISGPCNETSSTQSKPYLLIAGTMSHQDPARERSRFGLVVAAVVSLYLSMVSTLSKSFLKMKLKDTDFMSLVVCIVVFSCGLCWFVTMQTLNEPESLSLVLLFNTITSLSYTASSIYYYWDNAYDFSSAIQMTKVSHGLAILTLSTSIFVGSQNSTWLCFSMYSFLSSLVLRFRKNKSDRTISLGNLSSILSWGAMIFVCFYKYGISIASAKESNFTNVHKSIFITFLASILLLPMEASSKEGRSKMTFDKWMSSKIVLRSYGLFIPYTANLFSSNFSISIFLTGLVLIVVTIYKILFHGIAGSGSFNTESVLVLKSDSQVINIAHMFRRTIYNVELQARFDGSGFFTTSNPWIPVRHLIGLIIAPLPTWYIYYKHIFQTSEHARTFYFIPLHIFPLFFCTGIPSLRAITILSCITSIFIARYEFQDKRQKSRIL